MRARMQREAIGLVGSLLVWASVVQPAWADDDFFGEDFESFTGVARTEARELGVSDLDEIRGGYAGEPLGFWFTVTYAGEVEMNGTSRGNLDIDAGFSGEHGSFSLQNDDGTPAAVEGGALRGSSVVVRDSSTGDGLRLAAVSGDSFNGARGVFQITQVPGDRNNISTQLSINIAILEATEQNVDMVRNRLLTIPSRSE